MVTDAMIEAGLQHYSEGGCSGLDDRERREVVQDIITSALAQAETQPVAWVIPGRDNADANGFIDAMAWEEGEFTRPLFTSPVPAKREAGADFDRITTLEAELQKAREALSELERYVSMECYDQWLPEGHAKTSRLSRLIDRTQAAIRALSQDKEARDEAL